MARRKNTNKNYNRRKDELNEQAENETLVDAIEVNENANVDFIEKNQSKIFGALALVVLLVGAYLAYKTLVKEPKQKEAIQQMYQAQNQFEQDSFALALSNPGGGYGGFLDIINNYSGTPAANLAKYYAGICHLNLGQYQEAIDQLSSYSADGNVTPIMKNGAMGDAYAELGDMDNAMSYYNKAVSAGDNELLTAYYLKKVGLLQQKNNDKASAKATFEKIRDRFPSSPIAQDAEKLLSRVAN